MSWSNAKTNLEALLQGDLSAEEIEVDGHRVKNRSLKELVELEDYICHKADEEANGETNLTKAGFRTQGHNCGDGLV